MSIRDREHLTSAEVRRANQKVPAGRIRTSKPAGLERITPGLLARFEVETDPIAATTFLDTLHNHESDLFDLYTSRLYELFGRTKGIPQPEPPFDEADYRLALVWSQRLFENNPKIQNMETLDRGVVEALNKLDSQN